jgi:DNA (cytosine-5)-methyltransferase 1
MPFSPTTGSLKGASVASLFSGVGGLDSGFHQAGAHVIFACDLSQPACDTYERNFFVTPERVDIMDIAPKSLSGTDIVLAGPPCQGFSSIGARDVHDDRNQLILHTARLIASIKPRYFLIENVQGLRWLAGGRYLARALSILHRAGLSAAATDLDCCRFGVPQRRRRVIIAGGRGTSGRKLVLAMTSLSSALRPITPVSHVLLPAIPIGSLPNHDPFPVTVDWYAKVMRAIGPGQKLCDTRLAPSSIHSWDIPVVFGRVSAIERDILQTIARLRRSTKGRRARYIGDGRPVRLEILRQAMDVSAVVLNRTLSALASKNYVIYTSRHVDLKRKFNGRFKRLRMDAPAPAVLSEFSSPRNILHPSEHRALTVRECARLQGFSDSFTFLGTRTAQYQLVANAFPPPVSEALALLVSDAGVQHRTNTSNLSIPRTGT